jgi:DNA polymerase-3 subunit beta
VVVDREELHKAVRLSSLIASSSANVVRLRVDGSETGSVTIAAAADVGDTEGEVEAQVEGDGVTIAFNARYLLEALANVRADQLALEFTGPLSPGVLKPVGDDSYVHVIMPVRTPS